MGSIVRVKCREGKTLHPEGLLRHQVPEPTGGRGESAPGRGG